MLWFYSPLPTLAAESNQHPEAQLLSNQKICNEIASVAGLSSGLTVAAAGLGATVSAATSSAFTGALGGVAVALLHGAVGNVVLSAAGAALTSAAGAVALPITGAALAGLTIYEVIKTVESCDNIPVQVVDDLKERIKVLEASIPKQGEVQLTSSSLSLP